MPVTEKPAYITLSDRFRVQGSRFKDYNVLISIILYSMVRIGRIHPLGETWNLTRLTRNTIVRDQLGHFNWEP